jgi:hypothetical protein
MADTPRQLRDIEILTQQQMEHLESEGQDDVTLREIQKILYSTEVKRSFFPSESPLLNPRTGGIRGA